MRGSLLVLTVSVATASLSLAACQGDGRDDYADGVDGNGTMTLEWTIGGSTDPQQCAAQGASGIQIDVYDANGNQVGTFDSECTPATDVISLSPGRYSATAELTDTPSATGQAQARTTVVDIDPFDITSDTNFTIPVDFPISSFL
jgi:type 1 fimbria pilin